MTGEVHSGSSLSQRLADFYFRWSVGVNEEFWSQTHQRFVDLSN